VIWIGVADFDAETRRRGEKHYAEKNRGEEVGATGGEFSASPRRKEFLCLVPALPGYGVDA
jgi:hypothetical protein